MKIANEDLESLRPEWSELWNHSPRATPFQSPEWLLPWTRHLFGGGDILAMTSRDETGRLIGLAPLFRWGVEQRTLSFSVRASATMATSSAKCR